MLLFVMGDGLIPIPRTFRLGRNPQIEELLGTVREGLDAAEVGRKDVRASAVRRFTHINFAHVLQYVVNRALLAVVAVDEVVGDRAVCTRRPRLRYRHAACARTDNL